MKQSSRASGPDEIASAVRLRVEEFLRRGNTKLAAQFPSRIETLARNLALWGAKMNLTAHPEDAEESTFHVLDSLMPLLLARDASSPLAGCFAAERRILDLGSGAGFPGLVLAAACDAHFTLVESRRKRASFLQIAKAEMGLANVVIESRRAEEIDFARQFDLVTSRAFGDPMEFFALASRALKPGGLAMLYASPSQKLTVDFQRIPYHLERKGQRVDRTLAVWRQP